MERRTAFMIQTAFRNYRRGRDDLRGLLKRELLNELMREGLKGLDIEKLFERILEAISERYKEDLGELYHPLLNELKRELKIVQVGTTIHLMRPDQLEEVIARTKEVRFGYCGEER